MNLQFLLALSVDQFNASDYLVAESSGYTGRACDQARICNQRTERYSQTMPSSSQKNVGWFPRPTDKSLS